ncbi:copper amine oxidase N-terminal domain-containing protein [Paenibacillus sp. CMAA1364]
MLLCFSVLFSPVTNAAATNANVILNGQQMTFNPGAVVANGRTMVPFRQLFEQLGVLVSYDEKIGSIIATSKDTKIKLTVNSLNASVNGKEYTLTQAPGIDGNGVLYVNLRFISEVLGYEVQWNRSTLTVDITSK